MFDITIGIILLVAAVFLVVSILFQSSKSHRMSGVISGGAETFFGKTKGKDIDRVLGKMTAVVAVIFCVLVIVMFVAQDQNLISSGAGTDTTVNTDTTVADDTTGDTADTTDAATDTTDAADSTEE